MLTKLRWKATWSETPSRTPPGPSLNILLKLMAIVSLVFAPAFVAAPALINL